MAWPITQDLQQEVADTCAGFMTGVFIHSLAGICKSKGLLSNAELKERESEGAASHTSQRHDFPSAAGYDCVYFRGVRRRRGIDLVQYRENIVNSRVSVGYGQGLLFYVDFQTAFDHLEYGFANPTDLKGRKCSEDKNKQIDSFVKAMKSNSNPRNPQGMPEITFMTEVPLFYVAYIGVNFGSKPRGPLPSYFNEALYHNLKEALGMATSDEKSSGVGSKPNLPKKAEWLDLMYHVINMHPYNIGSAEAKFNLLENPVVDKNGNQWYFFQNSRYPDRVLSSGIDNTPVSSQPSQPSQPSRSHV